MGSLCVAEWRWEHQMSPMSDFISSAIRYHQLIPPLWPVRPAGNLEPTSHDDIYRVFFILNIDAFDSR